MMKGIKCGEGRRSRSGLQTVRHRQLERKDKEPPATAMPLAAGDEPCTRCHKTVYPTEESYSTAESVSASTNSPFLTVYQVSAWICSPSTIADATPILLPVLSTSVQQIAAPKLPLTFPPRQQAMPFAPAEAEPQLPAEAEPCSPAEAEPCSPAEAEPL